MKISYLPHTADVRMRVEAPDLETLFAQALQGMNDLLKEGFCRNADPIKNGRKIELSDSEPAVMLIDFLSEALSLSYTESCLFCESEILLSKDGLYARLYGTPVGLFDEEIKAVTYHEAKVERRSDDVWEASILFDL